MKGDTHSLSFTAQVSKESYEKGAELVKTIPPVEMLPHGHNNQGFFNIFKKLMPKQPITRMDVQTPNASFELFVATELTDEEAMCLAIFMSVTNKHVGLAP